MAFALQRTAGPDELKKGGDNLIVKSIPGYEGLYSADTEGDIWNDKTWTILAQDKKQIWV